MSDPKMKLIKSEINVALLQRNHSAKHDENFSTELELTKQTLLASKLERNCMY